MIYEGLRIILSDIIKIIMERRGGSGGKKIDLLFILEKIRLE